MKKIIFIILCFCGIRLCAQENEQSNTSRPTINPMALQPITVTIGGDFIVTGSFVASKNQRLDFFITAIYTNAEQQAMRSLNQIENIRQMSKELKKYALRNITLKRTSGDVITIDLLKFRLTGDFKYNPYLMNDDVIIFPSYDAEKNIIDVNGAVNKPVKFQFVEGDKLSDALLFTGGIDKAYDNVKKAEISRLSGSGSKETILTVDLNEDFMLKSGDRIKVLADENNKLNYQVLVLGQVKTPGPVFITRDSTTLADVIVKAGGFKSNADLRRAEIVRDYTANEMLKKQQIVDDYLNNSEKLLLPETQLRLRQMKETFSMMRLSNLTDEDTIFFNIDNQLRILRSESLVDFTKLSNSNSEESQFIVKPGDLILIPDKFEYVYVFGQVPRVGYIKYSKGQNYKYYLEKAGGMGETARKDDDVVLIKQKDMNWITKGKDTLKVEPGDFIYVPKEIPRTFWYNFSKAGAIIGVISGLATIYLLLTKL